MENGPGGNSKQGHSGDQNVENPEIIFIGVIMFILGLAAGYVLTTFGYIDALAKWLLAGGGFSP